MQRSETPPNGPDQMSSDGGVAVATEPVVLVADDEFRQKYLEIRTDPGGSRLVTVIEVLNPSNKKPGEHNRDPYVRKQRELLAQQVHRVEIDLVRDGMHSTIVPESLFRAQVDHPEYHICVSRFDRPRDYHVDPIRLGEQMPAIRIPLLPGAREPVVDFQPLLERCYEAGRYALRVDYSRPPIPPLTPEQAARAEPFLRQHKSR
mgnify:CR=1 FL=1